jgi:predicted amidophosphoribosyltransferase
MSCKGLCQTVFKNAVVRRGLHVSPYAAGLKRCKECEIYLDLGGTNCPCCGKLLRFKPRVKAHTSVLQTQNPNFQEVIAWVR